MSDSLQSEGCPQPGSGRGHHPIGQAVAPLTLWAVPCVSRRGTIRVDTSAQIEAMLNVPRTTVYGHLNKRTPPASSPTDPANTTVTDSAALARMSRICSSCGYEPNIRAEAAHQRADLAVIWLHPHPGDPRSVIARSHCHHCEPLSTAIVSSPLAAIYGAFCGHGFSPRTAR